MAVNIHRRIDRVVKQMNPLLCQWWRREHIQCSTYLLEVAVKEGRLERRLAHDGVFEWRVFPKSKYWRRWFTWL